MSTLTYIGVAFIMVILAMIIIYVIKTPKKKKDASNEYTTALNYLIVGENKKALEKFRESVKLNTGNIDAYIKIGDILREEGEADRAIKIHRGLMFRRTLTTAQKIDIYKSLIKDYQTCNKFDRAIQICQKLFELTQNDLWTQEIMLQLYESSGDWDSAGDMLSRIQKLKGIKDRRLLALYKVQSGLKCIAEGKERDGRIKFREAIKFDKICPPAYLNLSDSYIRENRYDDALSELKKFISLAPHLSYLGFSRIKNILFHEGKFSEVEVIFKSLLQQNPEDESIRLSLVDILERKGQVDKAINLCNQILERNPDNHHAKRYLAQFMERIGKKEKALDHALRLIDDLMKKTVDRYTCKSCGYVSEEPAWHCPQCHKWNTFLNS
jgi:lipopolysaccharide biosynthesis regulator YciM